jgi:hypothetical protein
MTIMHAHRPRRDDSRTPARSVASVAILACLVAFTCAFTPSARADFIIQGPDNYLYQIDLWGFPVGQSGTSTLNPDSVFHLDPPEAGSDFMNTFLADMAQYPGWTAITGDPLYGIMQINDYLATAPEAQYAGARMNATYTPVAGEPEIDLRWIQMFDSSYSGMHIDPFPNDDGLPFYYTEPEHAEWGLTFDDNPEIGPLPVPWDSTHRFELYLCTSDFITQTITVHDGFCWGYDAMTIPAPASVVFIGLLIGVRRRRRC